MNAIRIRNIIYAALPITIAIYLIYPLLAGNYYYPLGEHETYKSFMINFINTLKTGVLPIWNEYVGCGHPAMYFGHYPISQNTIVYMLFGFSDFTYYLTRCLNLMVLFFTFIYACRFLKLSYWIALIGALVYLSVNFVTRFLISETIGNLLLVYPLLAIFIIKIIKERKTKDILIFSLFYIFWLSGGHLIYVYMHLAMLIIFYCVTVFVFYGREVFKPCEFKRFMFLGAALFAVPFMAVLYQYLFVYDIIASSSRFKEGMVVSLSDPVPWKHFAVSLSSSSYLWMTLFLSVLYAVFRIMSVKYDFLRTKNIRISNRGVFLAVILIIVFCVIKPGFFRPSAEETGTVTAKIANEDSTVLKLGENILKNGDFSTGIGKWDAHLAVLSSSGGGNDKNCLKITTSQDATGYAYYTVPTETGKMYNISVFYKNGTAPNGQIKVGTKIDDTSLYYSGVLSNVEWRRNSGTFRAAAPITYITLVALTSIKGATVFFDSVTFCKLKPAPAIISDYISILKSGVFRIALFLFSLISLISLWRQKRFFYVTLSSVLNCFFLFVVYVSLLSHYFYSPENIIGDVNGYDFDLFRELSVGFQVIFVFCVLNSMKEFWNNKAVKIMVLSLVILYLIRSHFTIPLMRFTGIIWYATRDGPIFSAFFAILFMFGLKDILSNIFRFFKNCDRPLFVLIKYSVFIVCLGLVVQNSYHKFYKGTSHRYVYGKRYASTPRERHMLKTRNEIDALDAKLVELYKTEKHFCRTFTPENHYQYIAGNTQKYKIHEAAMYESSISKELYNLYDYTILVKTPPSGADLADLLPYFLFTKHVHDGLGLQYRDIKYGDFFLFSPERDLKYLGKQNIGFLWDLMQVKYLIIGKEFSRALKNLANSGSYELLSVYPALNLNLYKINSDKIYSKLAVYPLTETENYDDAVDRINSKNIKVLREMYSKLVFLNSGNEDFKLTKKLVDGNNRYYDITASKKGILIDFESWNRYWKLKINDKDEWLQKAFQMFKAIKIEPGLNNIRLTFYVWYFNILFWIAIFTAVTYAILLAIHKVLGDKKFKKMIIKHIISAARAIYCHIKSFCRRHAEQCYRMRFLSAIILILVISGVFTVDENVINKDCLWDITGRPYSTFLYEMNLPDEVGAVFVGGTPDSLIKIEKHYTRVNAGHIFMNQLRSFLFGTKITAYSIASYISFIFGFSAILFSLLAGYLIFRNGYVSIALLLLIIWFRNSCPGLIYGLPLRHALAVFNPLFAFSIIVLIVRFFEKRRGWHWPVFVLSGFIIGYISHCRASEGYIVIAASLIFFAVMLLSRIVEQRKNAAKMIICSFLVLITTCAGYTGYYGMLKAFEYHRDNKFNFPPGNEENILSMQSPFHSLYISLFRYDIPNRFGDKIGFDAVYEKYPKIKKKYSHDVNYMELAASEEYYFALKEIYFDFVVNNPGYFSRYLIRSVYDYFLFLPYYSWTGEESAHAYLPKINKEVEIEENDLAPDFKNTPFNWILNLKLKYLPKSCFFWIYFIAAYILLFEAIYVSCKRLKVKADSNGPQSAEDIIYRSSIYLLRGMLIYFFFASVVRTIIPTHGQGAVVAFNIIVIYNLERIMVFKFLSGKTEQKRNCSDYYE